MASVNCFRIVRSGTGRETSLLRLKQSPAAGDHRPLPLSTTQVTQRFGGGGLAEWREWGETPLPTDYRKVQMTSPVSSHPVENSHAFLIFSLT